MECNSSITKNTFESVRMRWMKLEPIIQSEGHQKETRQYSTQTHIYGISKNGNDDPICERAKETQLYRRVFWTPWEKARERWFERRALKHVYYSMWTRSPVQVWCMRLGAQGWCTGMALRHGMGREMGGGTQDGDPMDTHGWFMSMYGKNHYNIAT